MPDYPLLVFATNETPLPLAAMRDVLLAESAPANFGVEIAGEATEEQLADPAWDAAFLRWLEPDVHEVALFDPMVRGADEEAESIVGVHLRRIARLSDVAGRMIVADYLGRTRTVYGIQILPALIMEESHDGWEAIEALLRFLASATDGLVYAEAEGYCDADGELLLAETDDLNTVSADELD